MSRSTLPPLPGKHTGFIGFAALGFALLYTETGAYSTLMAGSRPVPETAILLGIGFLLVFGGFLASLILPARSDPFPEGDFQDATPVLHYLSSQMVRGAGLVALTSLGALLIYLYLVWPNLVAAYNLIKDLFIYMAVGIIYYQAVVTFVRYLNFLYRVKLDNATKVMVAEVSLILLTLILGLYLLTLDVLRLAMSPDPTGIMGLHVTLRAIWLAILILVALAWHFKWVADH